MRITSPFTVVITTNESLPQHRGYRFTGFTADKKDKSYPLHIPTVIEHLTTGDYAILGFEDATCVERKALADLYGTVGKGRKRFERELERMSAMRSANIVVEATWLRVFKAQRQPGQKRQPGQVHSRLPFKTIFRSVMAWKVRYPTIQWDFVPDRFWGERFTYRYLEKFWHEHCA